MARRKATTGPSAGQGPSAAKAGLRCRRAVVKSASPRDSNNMRADTEKLVEDIKQSIGLLRRHL